MTLCDLMVCSLPSSSIHGISQARIFEWVPFPSPGIFPTQGLNPHLLHWQVDSLPLSQRGSPSVPITSFNTIRMLGHHQFLLLVLQPWHGENESIVLAEQRVMKSLHGQHCGTAVSPLLVFLRHTSVNFTIPPTERKVKVKAAQSCPTLCTPWTV